MRTPVDPWEGQPFFPGHLAPSDDPTDPLQPHRGRHRRKLDWIDWTMIYCFGFFFVVVTAFLVRALYFWLRGTPEIIHRLPQILPS